MITLGALMLHRTCKVRMVLFCSYVKMCIMTDETGLVICASIRCCRAYHGHVSSLS